MANYNYVIDSHFKPFSFQEMVAPYMIYKDAYDKAEEKYHTMVDRANVFKYLSETLPETSRARQIYEGFARDLEDQTRDFLQNGLTLGTRGALTSLRGRIQGEIGMLEKADEKFKEATKVRDTLKASGKQVLYANDNPTIDDYLPGSKFNDYSIGTDALYTAGFNAAKSASSRKVWAGDAGSVMGYYRDWVQKQGFSEEDIASFSDEMRERFNKDFVNDAVTHLPGLQKSLVSILKSEGVLGNLKGNNLNRALEATLRGMVDGAMYQETHSPQRDLGTISAETQASLDMQKASLDFQKEEAKKNRRMKGFDENGKYLGVEEDQWWQRQQKLLEKKAELKLGNKDGNSSGSKSGTKRGAVLNNGLRVRWKGDVRESGDHPLMQELDFGKLRPNQLKEYAQSVGDVIEYDKLPQVMKDYVDRMNIDPNVHRFYMSATGYDSMLQIEPNNVKVTSNLNALDLLSGLADLAGDDDYGDPDAESKD